MSNFGDDIRRIARYEKLIKLITQAQATADQAKKLAIDGKRSIAYLDRSSLGVTGATGATGNLRPNVTLGATAATNAASAAAGAALALANGSPSNGATSDGPSDNIDDLDNTDKDGTYNAASELDGQADTYGKQVASAAANEVVRWLNNLKTADGRHVAVGTQEGSYKGPTAADSAYSGVPDGTWELGKTWMLITGSTPLFGATATSLWDIRAAYDGTVVRADAGGNPHNDPAVVGDSIVFTNTDTFAGGTTYAFQAYAPGVAIAIGHYGQQDCGVTVGDSGACSVTQPPAGNWPDLGITQLAWVSGLFPEVNPLVNVGRFMPNPFDVSVPTEYVGGASILDLQTLDDVPVRIGPLRNGGWYMYYRDPMNANLPAGDIHDSSVYTIQANRVVGGFITPSELATLLP